MAYTITVRCKPEEHAAIKAKAESYGMELSEYIRFVSLHAEIKTIVKKP